MTTYTDQDLLQQCKHSPHCPINLPLAIISDTPTSYSSEPILQPFKYEVYCPISCSGIKIGVANKDDTTENRFKYTEFRTTSSRVVQVDVNGNIVYTLNGFKPQKKEKKKTDNLTSYGIALNVDLTSNVAILNPFYLSGNILELFTLTLPRAVKKGLKLTFEEMEFTSDHFEIEGRKIFYQKNRVCYRPIFTVPSSNESLVHISSPWNRNQFAKGKVSELKEIINNNLDYWLLQLQRSDKIYNSRIEEESSTEELIENIDDVFTQLGFWLDIDEQLRCQLLDANCSKIYKEHYPNYSRLYTAIQRLSSFLNYGNTRYNVVKLAELGFFNKSDLLQNLSHYEDPLIPIPNIQEGEILTEQNILKKSLPHLRSLSHLPFPNIQLSVSVNSMPAQSHNGSNISKITTDGHFFGLLCEGKHFSLWSGEMLLLNYTEFNLSQVFKKKEIKIKSKEESKNPGATKCEDLSDLFQQIPEENKDVEEQEVIIPDPDKLDQLINMGFPVELSKQALIATKNEKIHIVIDSLEQIKAEEQVKRKKKLSENKLTLKNPWNCFACTMMNSCDNDICSVCQSPAPFSEYIDQEEEQRELEKKKKEEQAKIEEEKRRQKEKELKEKKRLEQEALKRQKQEQERLQNLIKQAPIIDIKIIYLQKRALDPFFVVALFKLEDKTLLRVFRIGLLRSYIDLFFRKQSETTIVSNFNQSIKPYSFESVTEIIKQAHRSVHWGRKLFEPVDKEWTVEQSQDLYLNEQITSFNLKQMNDGVSVTLVSSQDKKLYVDILPKDNKDDITFTLKQTEEHCEQRNVIKNKLVSEFDNDYLNVRCNKVEYLKDLKVTIPAGRSYLELEIVEHLPRGQFTIKNQVFFERKCQQGYEPLMKNFIPLRIDHFEGSLASEKVSIANLFQPGPLYVSNYPFTNFAFKSLEDRQMVIDSVAILSDNKASNSGYPIKSGLIFVVDQISWFFVGKSHFQTFDMNDYNNWLREKGSTEPAQWQPVGAFDIKEKEKSIEFDLDFKRPGKIICLLPTAVFKKGNLQFEESSVVIDFFGVKGRVLSNNQTSVLKSSTMSQIESQGCKRDFLKFYTNYDKKDQVEKSDIEILQKSQVNGTKFMSYVSEQSLKNVETSVSSHVIVRLKKVNEHPLEIQYRGHGKLISLKVVNSISSISNNSLGLDQNSKTYPSQLYDAVRVNPFYTNEILKSLNIKKFLTSNLLSEQKQIYNSWKLITIFRQNKEFELKLLQVIGQIFETINEENVKVTPQGLRYFLRLFNELSINNKPKTTDIVLKIWSTSSDFVKKIRNSNYRILRNRYNIKQLILEQKLFSEFYHNTISPQLFAGQSKTELITIPPRNIIQSFFHRAQTASSSTYYFRFAKASNVEKVRFYFQQTEAKYKLRLKLFKVDKESETSYRKSLVYHRVFDEQLMLELGTYAFGSQNWIYKSNQNYFQTDNLNLNAQYFIFEVNYNLIGSFFKGKKQHQLNSAVIIPVFISSETEYPKWTDVNSPVLQTNFEQLFSEKKNAADYMTFVTVKGLPNYKQIDNKYSYFPKSEDTHHQTEEQSSSNLIANQIVAHINNKEAVLAKKAEIDFKNCYGAKGLDFSYTFLIMINKFVCNSFIKQQLQSRGSELTEVLLKMYDTFVVNEIGPICENVTTVITELLQIMDNVELSRFVVKVVDKYLTDLDNLRNKPPSEEYDIKHVIRTLQKLRELPLAQLLDIVDSDSSKLRKINVLQLIEYSLTHSNYELQIYDLESNKLVKQLSLEEVLDKLYLFGLGLIANESKTPSNLQISLLNLCLDNILLVINNLLQKPGELKIVLDKFLILHSKQNIWILIFNSLKLPDQKLNKNINILMKHLINNVNSTFNDSINNMISQIINKNSNSLYMRISGEVSHEIWMKHLQSMLEFLVKSQQETAESKFQLNFQIADSLIKLPLTPALWAFSISILPVHNEIVKTLINQISPELFEILEISIMKYSANFKQLQPLRYAGKDWLLYAKKLFIEGKGLIDLLVDIMRECNYGGREAVLMANEDKIKKLQIANSLLQGIIPTQPLETKGLAEENIKSLIQWLLLNKVSEQGHSPITDLIKSVSDNLLKLFQTFVKDQNLVKSSIKQLLKLKKQSEIIERLCREKFVNGYNSLILTQRICECFETLIKYWVKTDAIAHYFAFDLEGYDYLFNVIGQTQEIKESNHQQLLDEDIFLDSLDIIALDKDKSEKKQDSQQINQNNHLSDFKQEQFANKVKKLKQGAETFNPPTVEDWTTHKKGSKSKVLTATMNGAFEQQYPVTIELEKQCELKYIRLGMLIADGSSAQSSTMTSTPASIFIEVGQQINNLEPLGELVPINDEGYAPHSVKIFVKNFQEIQSKENISSSIKSLGSIKVKFIKFTFRRPVVTFMEGFSTQTGKPYKTLAFQISFLSITGYDTTKLSANYDKRCNQICKKTALTVLYQLLNQQFISTINKLSNEVAFVQRLKSNFKQLTSLMIHYQTIISSINYILGANNEELGDWMIDYYLKNGVIQNHSELVSQIILSNASKIYPRLQLLLNRLLENIAEIVKLGNALDSISKFSTTSKFLETFCNSVYSSISTSNRFNKLEIKLGESDVDNILSVYESSHHTSLAHTLIQFLLTLIYIKPPYYLSKDLIDYTLNKVSQPSGEEKIHFQEFMTALIVSKKAKSWLEKDNKKKIEQVIENLFTSINEGKIKQIEVYLGFLIQVAMHFPQYLFEKHNLHIKIYEQVKQKQLKIEVLSLVQKLIELIIFNNPGSEKEFVDNMIKDIDTLSKIKDANFLKFYMNLLGSEEQIHVTLKGLSNIPKQDFTIPSDLLTKDDRIAIVKQISQKAKYTLCLTVDEDQNESIFNSVHAALGTSPYLIISEFEDEKTGEKLLVGAYFAGNINENKSTNYFELQADTKNFLFSIEKDDKDPNTNRYQFFHNDGEEEFGNLSGIDLTMFEDQSKTLLFSRYNNPIFKLSFCEEEKSFQKIVPEKKHFSLKKTEFWDIKHLNSKARISVDLQQSTTPMSYYRPERVYIIPAHITSEKLLNMIGVSSKLLYDGKEVEKNKVLGSYISQTEDFIVDMEINLLNCQPITANKNYVPRMLLYNEFDNQLGANRLFSICLDSMKSWNSQANKKRWSKFIEDFLSLRNIPNIIQVLVKNVNIFSILIDILVGNIEETKFTKDWPEIESKLNIFFYEYINGLLADSQVQETRRKLIDDGLLKVVLNKLAVASKQTVRKIVDDQQEQGPEPEKQKQVAAETKPAQVPPKKQGKKKKKGTGYGSDSHNNNNTKWNTAEFQQSKKQMAEDILRNVKILAFFLDTKKPIQDPRVADLFKQSCLLPLVENALRSSSILDVSKEFSLFMTYLELIRLLAQSPVTINCLLEIEEKYQPKQNESIFGLLERLKKTADIYISCLSTMTEKQDKNAEQIGLEIKSTFNIIERAVSKLKKANPEQQMKDFLKLPLNQAYRKLLQPLRFDSVSMKQGDNYKHLHSSYIGNSAAVPPPLKTLRLSQELADLSSSLPCQHTNAIFVRCDKDRIDVIRALIMGSKDTPYSNGAFLFDIFCEDTYPNQPPKMLISTTGGAKIRFNPNLYHDGKVCLSLLGTWKGQPTQNWDPKLSTLLQLFVSTQSIIMNEDIYFNEPGYENEQGEVEGERKNQGYANIVRIGNIKYAMIDQIKNPPKGFEEVIHRHFYLKKKQILQECQKWIQIAQTKEAAYTNLTHQHNITMSTELKKSKTAYLDMLKGLVKQLAEVLGNIEEPKFVEKVKTINIKKTTHIEEDIIGQELGEIDMTYEKKQADKEMNYEDEQVKDRWSRYIGAMGLEAVKKQSESQVLLIGLGTLGLQIAKNLILSGLKRLTIVDNEVVKSHTEHFYLTDMPGELRYKCIFKLQQLNRYVKVDHSTTLPDLAPYTLVIDTRTINKQIIELSNQCRKQSKKYISVESKGVYGRIFNDFGEKFEITDANGEEPVEIIIKNISNEEKGIVKLPEGFKHPYEDGEYVVIQMVEGMQDKEKQIQNKSEQQMFYEEQTGGKVNGINGRVFKIQVINSNSFRIGDTTGFTEYVRNGVVKNLKLPKYISFKPFEESLQSYSALPFDGNMSIYDFDKIEDNGLIQLAFQALGEFVVTNNGLPKNWDHEDAHKFVEINRKNIEELSKDVAEDKKQEAVKKLEEFFYNFSLVAESELPSIDAYLGGMASQQAIKAITNKFGPIQQLFTFHFKQLLPEIPKVALELEQLKIKPNQPFFNSKVILGKAATQKLNTSNIFIVGAGAIGCELLKNFAMMNLCSQGTLTVTDPDHIETSNLNRQFLFREKHIRKPKSSTASAAILQMNPGLKGHIVAKLDKVCEASENIYSDKFFKSLNLVTNALDNVQARLYVDRRCVANKVPLLESGTLGPKGHVQVIIPYITESYGSQNDPVEENQIPHCTLKLFPEQTLHCIEWSRDIFGKVFTLKPKALKKLIEDVKNNTVNLSEEGIDKVIKKAINAPKDFDECIVSAVKKFYKYYRNDIRQLLHTYPLTMKTKDGEPFWKLPKRPPKEITELDPQDELHKVFISSYAVNLAKTFGLAYPKNFRTEAGRDEIMKIAVKIKVPDFVPSEEGSKKINELNKDKKEETETETETEKVPEEKQVQEAPQTLFTSEQKLQIPKNISSLIAKPEEFEKDEDSNGHIDLIYSMANLRSRNYVLAPYTWIQTKLKAGRIMPALSTTTSVVSALQSIELIKIIKNSKVPKNTFANLAVPLIQMSQPGAAVKNEIGNTEFTVWDRWDVKANTLKQLYDNLSTTYDVEPVDSLIGGVVVFMKAAYVDKLEEEEKIMNRTFRELLGLENEDKEIDFTISFKDKKTKTLIENVPIVRVFIA